VQVIEDGLVRITAHAGRDENAFLRACGPGQVLGEELLLPRGERPGGRYIAAAALTACTTLAVSREAFLGCLRDRPDLWERLARDLIRRVAEDEDEERIMRLARDPVDVRLAWLLVYLTRLGGAVEEDGSLGLPINLSREDLALWIGAARRSVGAALQDWRSRGVTASRHGKLVIRDLGSPQGPGNHADHSGRPGSGPRSPRLAGRANFRRVLPLCRAVPEHRTEARTDGKCPADLPLRAPPQSACPPGSALPLSRASVAGNRLVWGVSATDVLITRVPLTSRSH
jgi:CRP-like cAMP-binding protein